MPSGGTRRGHEGQILDALFGPFWPFVALFGPLLAPFGGLVGVFCVPLTSLGAFFSLLCSSWSIFAHFGAILPPT